MMYFLKPENALKRAREFLDVGKKQRALDVLADVIKSRRHRTWQKIHDSIMIMYVNLCVDLKRSHQAKEGLFQYRNICQQVNIKSLEDIVRLYLKTAEDRTEAARQTSHQAVIDIDDLDNVQTPEGILLSAVSSEDSQDRTDRVVLLPWVKFLWESYRQCLELLRNNSRVERLYHDIAQQAFKFCLKYSRKTEFRKLCDNLRAHLGHIYKHQAQQTAVNLNNPESQAMHLETRLVQLDNAIVMELWQEAYKAIEDIHGLMALSKKAPKPNLMATYYQKLGLVFYKAGNHLNHASALLRLFQLSRELKKNITTEEIQRMASRVVLASLAIPLAPNRPDIDRLVETDENIIDKNNRALSTLLSLTNPPTRLSLVKDMVRLGIYNSCPQLVQELYRLFEVDMHPIKICSRVTAILNKLTEDMPDLKQYIAPLQDIAIMRLLKAVSQVYCSISFDHLLEMVPFADIYYIEKMVVDAARRNDLQVRIHHAKQCLYFGSGFNISQREEVVDGPHLQSMGSENTRVQLMKVYSVLSSCMLKIQPKDKLTSDLKYHLVANYENKAKKSHRQMLDRRQIIEERKEMLENLNLVKEEEERKQLEEKQTKLREAEKDRVARETEERTRLRQIQEAEEFRKSRCRERLAQLKKTEAGARVAAKIGEQELENLDPEELLNRQFAQIDKEQKDYQAKLRKQEKKLDHLERAKRIEEIPLLKQKYEEIKHDDIKFWKQLEKERIQRLIDEHDIAIKTRNQLLLMREDKDKFLERLGMKRTTMYKERLEEFNKKISEEREIRLQERAERRKEERKNRYLLKKEEEQHQKELEEQMAAEELERAKQEEIEAEKRAKEREIEKLRKEEELKQEEKKKDEPRPWRPLAARKEQTAPEEAWRKGGKEEEEDKKAPRRFNDQEKDWRNEPSKNRDADRSKPLERRFERPADGERDRGFGRDFGRNREGGDSDRFRRDGGGDSDRFRRDGGGDSDRFRRDDSDRFRRDGGGDSDRFRRDGDSDRFRRDGGGDSDRFRRDGGGDSDRFRRDGGGDSDRFRRDGGGDRDRFRRDDGDRFRRDGGDNDRFRGGDRFRDGDRPRDAGRDSDRFRDSDKKEESSWRARGTPAAQSPPEKSKDGSEDPGWTTVRR